LNELQRDKKKLRSHYKEVRNKISPIRREEAKEAIVDYLEEIIKPASRVLSFISLKDEVDLSLVNALLISEGKLHLNSLEADELCSYRVRDFEKETRIGKFKILEPDPNLCAKEKQFDCILVPAIAFDEKGNRLGYGFGYYDKLLSHLPDCQTIGVGFREQLSLHDLPCEKHDKPVSELCLV